MSLACLTSACHTPAQLLVSTVLSSLTLFFAVHLTDVFFHLFFNGWEMFFQGAVLTLLSLRYSFSSMSVPFATSQNSILAVQFQVILGFEVSSGKKKRSDS